MHEQPTSEAEVSPEKRIKQLEAENANLKRLVEDLHQQLQTRDEAAEAKYLQLWDYTKKITGQKDEAILEKKTEEQESTVDYLTGLFNIRGAKKRLERSLFKERPEKERRSEQHQVEELAVLFLDIDHFKQVNDTYGHKAGDQALGQAADHLQELFRDTDLIARWGGEEIVVIAPGMTKEQLIQKLRRLAGTTEGDTTISFKANFDGREATIGFSGGATTVNMETLGAKAQGYLSEAKTAGNNEMTIEEAKWAIFQQSVAEADQLMYAAKRSGRGKILTELPPTFEQAPSPTA